MGRGFCMSDLAICEHRMFSLACARTYMVLPFGYGSGPLRKSSSSESRVLREAEWRFPDLKQHCQHRFFEGAKSVFGMAK